MDEATCFSYVVPKIFASPLIVHINDNKFLIAIIIIVYFLYSFSFKLPLTVFINAHGCLIARLLLFFPSLDLPHFLCLEIPLINMHMHSHIHPRIFKTLPRDILWSRSSQLWKFSQHAAIARTDLNIDSDNMTLLLVLSSFISL